MRKFLSLVCGAALAAAAVAGTARAEAVSLKFAVFTPENEVTYRTIMKPWAERVMRDAD